MRDSNPRYPVRGIPDFESSAFGHSANLPFSGNLAWYIFILTFKHCKDSVFWCYSKIYDVFFNNINLSFFVVHSMDKFNWCFGSYYKRWRGGIFRRYWCYLTCFLVLTDLFTGAIWLVYWCYLTCLPVLNDLFTDVKWLVYWCYLTCLLVLSDLFIVAVSLYFLNL